MFIFNRRIAALTQIYTCTLICIILIYLPPTIILFCDRMKKGSKILNYLSGCMQETIGVSVLNTLLCFYISAYSAICIRRGIWIGKEEGWDGGVQ